jgi:preprotein translocase subunit YajC
VDAGLLVIVALFVVFWLLLIRPQRRRQRAQEDMLGRLRVGDEIVTAGGLYAEITAIEGDEVYVEIAEGVEVRLARRAVAGVLTDEEDELAEDGEEPDEPDELDQPEGEPEAGETATEATSKTQDGS